MEVSTLDWNWTEKQVSGHHSLSSWLLLILSPLWFQVFTSFLSFTIIYWCKLKSWKQSEREINCLVARAHRFLFPSPKAVIGNGMQQTKCSQKETKEKHKHFSSFASLTRASMNNWFSFWPSSLPSFVASALNHDLFSNWGRPSSSHSVCTSSCFALRYHRSDDCLFFFQENNSPHFAAWRGMSIKLIYSSP